MQELNTLIIFSDQHNARVTGCYGNEIARTPNLDRLAERGTLFEHAYTTNPICVPARASFANGAYASTYRYWDNCHAFAGDQTSWGSRLKDAGVKVSTIGKLHYKDDSEKTFPDQRIPMNITNGLGDPLTAIRTLKGNGNITSVNQIRTAGAGEADYVKYDRLVAKTAAAYLKEEAAGSKEPWCLFVGFTTPHNPYNVPEKYINQYQPFTQFPVSEEWKDDSGLHPALQEFRAKKRLNEQLLTDEEIQRGIAAYYGMVSFMDDMTGRVLDALREAGLEDTTRIIYLDDHGDCAGEHGLFFKCTMYEESAGIPLIMAGPGLPGGKRISAPVSIVDIYPTLLDFYHLEPTAQERRLPGISLLSSIQEGDPDRIIYSEYFSVGYDHSVFMIRKGKYKLVYYVGYDDVQLFDLDADPREKNDLGTNPDFQEIVEELKGDLYRIADPEELDRESLKDQAIMVEERGGIDAILANRKTVVPFTPVPKGIDLAEGD